MVPPNFSFFCHTTNLQIRLYLGQDLDTSLGIPEWGGFLSPPPPPCSDQCWVPQPAADSRWESPSTLYFLLYFLAITLTMCMQLGLLVIVSVALRDAAVDNAGEVVVVTRPGRVPLPRVGRAGVPLST